MASTTDSAPVPTSTDSAAVSSRASTNQPNQLSLQQVLVERDGLRKELAEARAEVMRLRCQAEMLRQEWFAAKLQEEEYRQYIRKLTGTDPYISAQEILDAETTGLSMQQILAEMAKDATGSPAGA
jgi:hypothetical protein